MIGIYNIEVLAPNGEWDLLMYDVPHDRIPFEITKVMELLGYDLNEVRVVEI